MNLSRATAHSIGIEAARACAAGGTGEIVALFQRSCYLRLGRALICLGDRSIGHGPLNAPCTGLTAGDWRAYYTSGTAVTVGAGALRLGATRIALDQAPVWAPAPAPRWRLRDLQAGLRALAASLPGALPASEGHGLAAWIHPGGSSADSPMQARAAPAIRALGRWLNAAGHPPCPAAAVAALLGLGPGLTPSGDDFLAGMLVALRAVRRPRQASELASRLEILAPRRTTAISLAHLRAAARAGLNQTLTDLLHALLRGDAAAVGAALSRRAMHDHFSPLDTLAGIATVLYCAPHTAGAHPDTAAPDPWQNCTARLRPESATRSLIEVMT